MEGTQIGAVPEELTPWKGLTLEQFLKNCSPRERLGEVHGGLSPVERTPGWSSG